MSDDYVIPPGERLSLTDAAVEEGVASTTIHRWMTVGFEDVRLRRLWVGSRVYTCRRWLDEYHAEVTRRRVAAEDAERAANGDAERTPETEQALQDAGLV